MQATLGLGEVRYWSGKGRKRLRCRFNLGGATPENESILGVWGCYSIYISSMFNWEHVSDEMFYVDRWADPILKAARNVFFTSEYRGLDIESQCMYLSCRCALWFELWHRKTNSSVGLDSSALTQNGQHQEQRPSVIFLAAEILVMWPRKIFIFIV